MNLPKCPMQSKQRHQTKCRNMLPPHGQMTIGELGLDFVIICPEVHNLAVIVAHGTHDEGEANEASFHNNCL